MKKPIKAARSFFGLNMKMKKEVVSIMATYIKVSCLIRFYPLRKYYHRYFQHDHIKPFDFLAYKDELKLIKKVIKQMPGKQTCLKESIVVHLSFKKKGLYIPLYLGVNTESELLAHAWYDQDSSNGYNQLNVSEKKAGGPKD